MNIPFLQSSKRTKDTFHPEHEETHLLFVVSVVFSSVRKAAISVARMRDQLISIISYLHTMDVICGEKIDVVGERQK